MSLKIIFEDKIESNISKLLLKSFDEDVLIFADGNTNIKNVILQLPQDTAAIIFIDVVPDNSELKRVYKELLTVINSDINYKNRFIVLPIPCIEYYVIKAFCNIMPSIEERYKSDYKNIYPKINNRLLRLKSFEKYCKSIVTNYNSCLETKFLIRECGLSCDCDNAISYDEKVIKILSSLPVVLKSKLPKENLQPADLLQIQAELIKLLKDVTELYKEYGYIK